MMVYLMSLFWLRKNFFEKKEKKRKEKRAGKVYGNLKREVRVRVRTILRFSTPL